MTAPKQMPWLSVVDWLEHAGDITSPAAHLHMVVPQDTLRELLEAKDERDRWKEAVTKFDRWVYRLCRMWNSNGHATATPHQEDFEEVAGELLAILTDHNLTLDDKE